jgi:SagB-type dehydrogenase family enzyme
MSGASAGIGTKTKLPLAQMPDAMHVGEALAARRSHSVFSERPLSRELIAQLCWAAQGMTNKRKKLRTTPSARSLFPLTLLLAHRDGIDEYLAGSHSLKRIGDQDTRVQLQRVAGNQSAVGAAPLCMAIAINTRRMELEFGPWAERLCLLEAGAAAENVLIEATSIGLVGIPIGAFEPQQAGEVLGLAQRVRPVLLLPVGHPTPAS